MATQLVTVRTGTCTLAVLAVVSIIITTSPLSCPLMDINAYTKFKEIPTELLTVAGSEEAMRRTTQSPVLPCFELFSRNMLSYYYKNSHLFIYQKKNLEEHTPKCQQHFQLGSMNRKLPLLVWCCLNFIQQAYTAFVSRKRQLRLKREEK